MTEFFEGDVHEVTKKLAYEFWEQRSHPTGSPEVDSQKAEEKLRAYGAALPVGPPLTVLSTVARLFICQLQNQADTRRL